MSRLLHLTAALAFLGAAAGCASNAEVRDETGPALRAETAPHQTTTGRITGVSANRSFVIVDRAQGGRLRLYLDSATVITADGKPAGARDIKEGGPIRAAYRMVNGRADALVVDVSRLGSPHEK